MPFTYIRAYSRLLSTIRESFRGNICSDFPSKALASLYLSRIALSRANPTRHIGSKHPALTFNLDLFVLPLDSPSASTYNYLHQRILLCTSIARTSSRFTLETSKPCYLELSQQDRFETVQFLPAIGPTSTTPEQLRNLPSSNHTSYTLTIKSATPIPSKWQPKVCQVSSPVTPRGYHRLKWRWRKLSASGSISIRSFPLHHIF